MYATPAAMDSGRAWIVVERANTVPPPSARGSAPVTPPVDFHTAPAAGAWQCLTPPGLPRICRVVTRRSGREKLHFLTRCRSGSSTTAGSTSTRRPRPRCSWTSRRSWRASDECDDADGTDDPGVPGVHQGHPRAGEIEPLRAVRPRSGGRAVRGSRGLHGELPDVPRGRRPGTGRPLGHSLPTL